VRLWNDCRVGAGHPAGAMRSYRSIGAIRPVGYRLFRCRVQAVTKAPCGVAVESTDAGWTSPTRTSRGTGRQVETTMKNLNAVAKFPEVTGAVLSDASGALIDSVGAIDGEAAGAINSFYSQSLRQVGEMLGLGALQKVTLSGPSKAAIVTVQDDEVLAVYVDPTKPLGPIEKKLETALSR
jgi:predicted regulator of Ras-like GTPase activity (Roadblock/LC7/MglB family)